MICSVPNLCRLSRIAGNQCTCCKLLIFILIKVRKVLSANRLAPSKKNSRVIACVVHMSRQILSAVEFSNSSKVRVRRIPMRLCSQENSSRQLGLVLFYSSDVTTCVQKGHSLKYRNHFKATIQEVTKKKKQRRNRQ